MVERLKTALIFLLGASALFLLSRTWVYDMEPEAAARPEQWAPHRPVYGEAAVTPARCAVTRDGVTAGAQYGAEARQVYTAFSPLLGEAVNTAGEAWEASWPYGGDGVLFEFWGSYPMPLLAAWLSADGPPGGEVAAVGLSFADGRADLFWIESDGSAWRARTEADEWWPELPEGLCPCVFLPALGTFAIEEPPPVEIVALTAPPDIRQDLAAYTPFMEALDMFPLSTNFYARGEGRVYIDADGGRSLEITPDGSVYYSNTAGVSEGDRLYVPPDARAPAGDVLAAWEVLSLLSPAMGDARFEVRKVERTDSGVTVTFIATVNYIPLLSAPAIVVIERNAVRSVSLSLRRALVGTETAPALSLEEAAALLDGGARLSLCYRDGGDGAASVTWAQLEG